jgi:hypothetical protein
VGVTKGDLIALKSQFFLSSNPNFIETIEALVKADEALYSGGHVAFIRDLFYNQIRWGGDLSATGINPANGQVEVGLKGCSAVHAPTENAASLWATLAVSLLFISFTLYIGRRRSL